MKVLIIRPAALGDTLMLMPAIAGLRASAELVLVARHPGLDYVRPYVHLAMDYEGSGWHRLFLEKMPDGHALSIPVVDSVVAFLGDPDGCISRNLRTFFPTASVHLFPAFPPKDARVHVALYLAQCFQNAGLPIDPGECLEGACQRPLLGRNTPSIRQNKVIFHPGSGGQKKNYPPEFWLRLIKRAKGDGGRFSPGEAKFILLLGPAEEQLYPFYSENLADTEGKIVCSPKKEELLSLIEQSSLYIGHDSGVTHLAAMLGRPTIALFKDSPAHQWRPLGPYVRIIEGRQSGARLEVGILKIAKGLIAGALNE